MVFGEGRGESYLDCQVLFLSCTLEGVNGYLQPQEVAIKIGCIHLIIYI